MTNQTILNSFMNDIINDCVDVEALLNLSPELEEKFLQVDETVVDNVNAQLKRWSYL